MAQPAGWAARPKEQIETLAGCKPVPIESIEGRENVALELLIDTRIPVLFVRIGDAIVLLLQRRQSAGRAVVRIGPADADESQ